MFSRAWHSCLPNFSRAPGCPVRYGAKSRTGISTSSLRRVADARLMLTLLVRGADLAGPFGAKVMVAFDQIRLRRQERTFCLADASAQLHYLRPRRPVR